MPMNLPAILPKIINMDGTPDPEADRMAALEERVQALEIWLGMVPLHPDVAPGATAPRKPAKAKDNKPTAPDALLVGRIFHRRPTTAWSDDEIKQFLKLRPFVIEDLERIERFYASERAKGNGHDGRAIGFHRHSLDTFLNNYAGELDKANVWAARNQKAAQRPLPNAAAPKTAEREPEGFRAKFDRDWPDHAGKAWKDLPDYMRKEYL